VIDADGLNLLAAIEGWPALLPPGTILTPHPGEFGRLAEMETADVQADRLALARDKAAAWSAIVVLKGAFTVVAAPDGRLAVSPFASAAGAGRNRRRAQRHDRQPARPGARAVRRRAVRGVAAWRGGRARAPRSPGHASTSPATCSRSFPARSASPSARVPDQCFIGKATRRKNGGSPGR